MFFGVCTLQAPDPEVLKRGVGGGLEGRWAHFCTKYWEPRLKLVFSCSNNGGGGGGGQRKMVVSLGSIYGGGAGCDARCLGALEFKFYFTS